MLINTETDRQTEKDAYFSALAPAHTIKNPRGPPALREQAPEGQWGPIGLPNGGAKTAEVGKRNLDIGVLHPSRIKNSSPQGTF